MPIGRAQRRARRQMQFVRRLCVVACCIVYIQCVHECAHVACRTIDHSPVKWPPLVVCRVMYAHTHIYIRHKRQSTWQSRSGVKSSPSQRMAASTLSTHILHNGFVLASVRSAYFGPELAAHTFGRYVERAHAGRKMNALAHRLRFVAAASTMATIEWRSVVKTRGAVQRKHTAHS